METNEIEKFIEWFEKNWDFGHGFAFGDLLSMYKRYKAEDK